jgi:predicted nucleic acid-binding protein
VVVVDSSVLIDAIAHPGRVVDRLADEELAAPHLIDAEIGHAIRRLARQRSIDEPFAAGAFDYRFEVEITRYPHVALMPRAWELRHNLSFYDALYIALAEALDAPLITLDRGLAGVPGTDAIVEVVP